jgi:AcrR family transcriptional regulator
MVESVESVESGEPDGRRRRAVRSRRRIVEAATARFVRDGYRATTIGAIARDAGVATQTIYYDFGTKRNVLRAVLDAAIAGDDATIPVRDQAWVDEVSRQSDPVAAVETLVSGAVAILARVAPVYDVLCHAAGEPDIGDLFTATRAGRRRDQRALVASLAAAGHLRPGLDPKTAADAVYALVNEEVYLLLVADCGWDRERFERWLTDAVRHQLLAPP